MPVSLVPDDRQKERFLDVLLIGFKNNNSFKGSLQKVTITRY